MKFESKTKCLLNDTVGLMVISIIGILRKMPPAWTRTVGSMLGSLAHLLRIRSGIIEKNLKIAFPELQSSGRKKLKREVYRHFGEFLGAWLSFNRIGLDTLNSAVKLNNIECLHRAFNRGKGVFCATAHFGNWELAGRILPQYCPDFYLVLKELKNRKLNEYFEKLHLESGMKSIYSKKSGVQIIRGLSKNAAVGILMDQNAGSRGIFVPFFGRPTSFHRGPAQIALKTGAAIITLFALPENGGWTITFREIETALSGDVESDTARIMGEYAAQLEGHVRNHPGFYFWFHNRWKVDPPSEETD
ncbi:lysophospholipid acyltransferase family protein [bacterium]|nr:lysophospholipid acyltransferase family protein [candidate division CSSED10-310 bacterium]